MNYLAHLHLARVSNTSPVGNLLGDFVKGPVPDELDAALGLGVRLHRRIDFFTDSHLEHRDAVACFDPPWRRFGGILVDLLYDHWLSVHWSAFSAQPLEDFLAESYAAVLGSSLASGPDSTDLPVALRRMAEQDWLSSYARIEGVHRALDGIGRRLRRPLALSAGLGQLDCARWERMEAGFLRFYPAAMGFAAREAQTLASAR
jgi:acyl carrier protein phosphodiesterase